MPLDLHSELHAFHADSDQIDDRPNSTQAATDEFHETDLEPPCARLFIDRGRSAYANMWMFSLFSHWSGKKGA